MIPLGSRSRESALKKSFLKLELLRSVMNEDILTNVNEEFIRQRNEPSSHDNNDLARLNFFPLTLQSRTQLANSMDFTLRVRYDTPVPTPFQHTSRDLDARK